MLTLYNGGKELIKTANVFVTRHVYAPTVKKSGRLQQRDLLAITNHWKRRHLLKTGGEGRRRSEKVDGRYAANDGIAADLHDVDFYRYIN